jgi:hypothetical protein
MGDVVEVLGAHGFEKVGQARGRPMKPPSLEQRQLAIASRPFPHRAASLRATARRLLVVFTVPDETLLTPLFGTVALIVDSRQERARNNPHAASLRMPQSRYRPGQASGFAQNLFCFRPAPIRTLSGYAVVPAGSSHRSPRGICGHQTIEQLSCRPPDVDVCG